MKLMYLFSCKNNQKTEKFLFGEKRISFDAEKPPEKQSVQKTQEKNTFDQNGIPVDPPYDKKKESDTTQSQDESPKETKETITGSQFEKELTAIDKSPLSREEKIAKMKQMVIEQAEKGNLYYGEMAQVALEATDDDGKPIQAAIRVTTRPIGIGSEQDAFYISTDRPTAEAVAQAAGLLLPTMKVVEAAEKIGTKNGFIPMIAAPEIAQRLLRKDSKQPFLTPDLQERLKNWNPNKPTGDISSIVFALEHSKAMQEAMQNLSPKDMAYGGWKAILHNEKDNNLLIGGGISKNGALFDEKGQLAQVTNEGRIQKGIIPQHEPTHSDYSQKIAFCIGSEMEILIDGKWQSIKTEDIMAGKEYSISPATGEKIKLPKGVYKLFNNTPKNATQAKSAIPERPTEADTKKTSAGIRQPLSQTIEKNDQQSSQTSQNPESQYSMPHEKTPFQSSNQEYPHNITPSPNNAGSNTARKANYGDDGYKAKENTEENASEKTEADEIPDNGEVFVLGDSLSEAFQDEITKFKTKHIHKGTNTESTGQSTGDVLHALKNKILPHEKCKGATLIVVIGSNDVFNNNGFETAKKNLSEIYKLAKKAGMKVVGGTLPPLGGSIYAKSEEHETNTIQQWELLNEWIVNMKGSIDPNTGEKTGPDEVIEFHTKMASANDSKKLKEEYFTKGKKGHDGLHPRGEGSKDMAKWIEETIKKVNQDSSEAE